jgi:hypothetical protein
MVAPSEPPERLGVDSACAPSTTGSAHRCRRSSLSYPMPFDCVGLGGTPPWHRRRHTSVAARTPLSDALRPCRDASSCASNGFHIFHYLLPRSACGVVSLRSCSPCGRREVLKVMLGFGFVWLVLVAWLVSASPFDHGVGTPVSSPQSRLSDALRLCLVSVLQRFVAVLRSPCQVAMIVLCGADLPGGSVGFGC